MVIDRAFHQRITGETTGSLIGDDRTTLNLSDPADMRIRGQCF